MLSLEDILGGGPPRAYPEFAQSVRDNVRERLHTKTLMQHPQWIDKTIQLARGALELSSRGNDCVGRLDACFLLSQSLHISLDCGMDSDGSLLQETVDVDRQSISLCGQGHQDRAKACDHLASSLKMLYGRVGDAHLLAEAVDLEREAIALRPPGHPARSLSSGILGDILMTYYQCTGDSRLLDEAISLEREVYDMAPEEHPYRAVLCEHLAMSLKMSYQRTGDCRLLDEVIDLERQALALLPLGHRHHISSCANLAASLSLHYERTGDSRVLDEAIGLEREALDLCPQGHPHRAMSCEALAGLCHKRYERYERTGDVRRLEEVIHLQREALALHPQGHPGRSFSCVNLAIFLKTQHGRAGPGNGHLLNEAIELEREALVLRPPGHPHRAASCESLAQSLSLQNDVHLWDEVINLDREALALRPERHPRRSITCGNLAASLKVRYLRHGDDALLREIVTLQQEAVAIAPAYTAWRHSCQLAWVHLQATSPFYDVNKAIVYLLRSLEDEHDNIPLVIGAILERIDIIWDHSVDGPHVDLTAIYQRLVQLLPLLAHPALDVQPQLQAMKASSRIGPDAFVNAAIMGRSTTGLEILEFAQGLIWSQNLHRRDPQLENVPAQLASKLQRVLQTIATKSAIESYSGEPMARTPHDTLHAHSSEAHALIREIRALPGLDRFMLSSTFEALSVAASHHPIVVLVGARGHYYALIITSSVIQGHALLTLDLTEEEVKNTFFIRGATGSRRGAHVSEDLSTAVERLSLVRRVPAPSNRLNRYLKVLWNKVVKPVLDRLGLKMRSGPTQVRPRLHWCPTGIFISAPLHAAGIYEGAHKVACADYVVSSYTPTITALLRAQTATAKPLSRSSIFIALFAEKRAQDPDLEVLYAVDEEIERVAAVARSTNTSVILQQAGLTTVTGTAAMMTSANMVHLACHGIQDMSDATQSGFCLGDGRLTIAKLMELKLDGAFLAFLSACETAKGDEEQPDQAMHLAAAMLFSGFKSVVATMWSISDMDGPMVAKWFYEDLLAKEVIDADSVAYALDSAAGKLRDSGAPLDRWAPFIHMGG